MSTNTRVPDESSKPTVGRAVAERYAAAANEKEASLCCPVTYDVDLLKMVPDEIIEKDYGCGDPSAYVRPGDTVLDLGSGGGKLCYIASQIVGAEGRVIGVDCNPDMLQLARKYQSEMAEKLGYANVDFRFGRIQDLALDLSALDEEIPSLPGDGPARSLELVRRMQELRSQRPLVESSSVDCVISNCVLNLVDPADRRNMFAEIFRVLRTGGRVAISDIVSDEDIPAKLQADPELWSGCISGAWREDLFLEEFKAAGFHGVEIAKYQAEAWQVVEGIEFRSMTLMAYKGEDAPCLEAKQAAIYRGPFANITTDDGSVFPRGQRMAVCDRTFRMLQRDPYADQFVLIQPSTPVTAPVPFDCNQNRVRAASETKGGRLEAASRDLGQLDDGSCCDPNTGCC